VNDRCSIRLTFIKQEMFVKHYAPKAFFVTDVLYNYISQFKISCTHICIRNSFSKLLLKQFGTFDSGDL